MKHINDLWESYAKTLPSSLPVEYTAESKLGFLCGAIALYNLMMSWAENEDISQQEGEQFLEDLQRESIEILMLITQVITEAKAKSKGEACA